MTDETKTTITKWKSAAVHPVTLPSSTVVDIRIPNLPEMIESGEIPNDLIDVAIEVAQGTRKVTSKDIKEQAEFYRHLVSKTVVNPKVTPEQVPEIPYEDTDMLVEIATRQRDVDALGHHIAGLHTNKDWRKFRGFESGFEGGEGL